MMNHRSQLTAIWIGCVVLFLGFVAYTSKGWFLNWRTNYIVGTFQGTFSLDQTRVRISPDKTGLVIARVEAQRRPAWIRSFSGLSPGHATDHVTLPDLSVLIVGVFERELRSGEEPERVLLRADGAQAVFSMRIRSDGRTIIQTVLASAEGFDSPLIKRRDDHFDVDIRYAGKLNVGGKSGDQGIRSPTLHLELSPRGENTRWEATGSVGPAVPVAPKMADMADPNTLGTCEVCRWYTPKDDANCGSVRGVVCSGDGWCCSTGWDRLCMNEALQPPLPGVTCTCVHGPHGEGELLHPQCPGPVPNCVSVVDQGDAFCGWNAWDGLCVSEASACPP
jgi:hypothetical protein